MSVELGVVGESSSERVGARADRPAVRDRRVVGLAARGAHVVLVALALVGCLQALFLFGVEGVRLVETRRSVTRLSSQVQLLQDEADGLQQVIDHAADDGYREDLARRQGFLYPNELRAVTLTPGALAAPAAGAP